MTTSNDKSNKAVCSEMCFYCFDTLVNHLNKEAPPKNPNFTDAAFPLFVTWQLGRDKRLRGCIGTFKAINLHDGLSEYAIQSATQDSRFNPIGKDEVQNLYVSVSLLTNFEPADNYLDWTVGIHGVRIEFFSDRGSRRSATFLPEVASGQGWSREQTIDELLRKGGHKGPITEELKQSIQLTRYQSEKLTVSYDEYRSWQSSRK